MPPSDIKNVALPFTVAALLTLGITISHATIVKSCHATSKVGGLTSLVVLYIFLGVVMLLGRQLYNICNLSSKTITHWKTKQYAKLECFGDNLCPNGQEFECALPDVGVVGPFVLIVVGCVLLAIFARANAKDSEKDEMNVGSLVVSFVIIGVLLLILWFTLKQHCATKISSGFLTALSYVFIVVVFGVTLPAFKSLFQKLGVGPPHTSTSPSTSSDCNSTQSSKILFAFVGLCVIAYLLWGNWSARLQEYKSTAISSQSSTGLGCATNPSKIGSVGMQGILWVAGFLFQGIVYWLVS
jgi:hypothetical protein